MALAGRVDGTEGSTVLDDVRNNGAVTTDLTLKMLRMPWGDRNVLNVVSCTWWRGVRARAAAVTLASGVVRSDTNCDCEQADRWS